MQATEVTRVKQDASDQTLSSVEAALLKRGDLLGDGMWHGGDDWSWTRIEVVANDRDAQTLVVLYPGREYFVCSYEEADRMWVRWEEVSQRAAR